MIQTAIAKIVGTPTDTAWSQVHNFTPLEEDKRAQRGALLAVLSIDKLSLSIKEEAEGVESIEAGREILARLHEEYFGHGQMSPFEQLKSAVSVVSKEFSPLELGIIASVVWKNYIYFCILGPGRVFIWRDGKLTQLLESSKQSVVFLSGTPQNGDVFILGTNAFFDIADTTSLKELLSSKKTLQEVVDNLVPLILSAGNSALSAAVFAKTEEEVVEVEQKVDEGQEASNEVINKFALGNVNKFVFGKIKVKDKLGTVSESLRSKIANVLLKIPERQISLRKDGQGSKKTMVSIGVILLLLLGVSIFFGLRQKNVLIYRSSYEDRLVSAQNAYSDSHLQKDVDPTRSRELFLQAKNTSFSLKNEGIKDSRLDELIVKLENDTATILGVVASKADVFLDLSLVRSGVSAGEVSLHGSSLAIMDRTGARLFALSTQGKETKVLAGPEKLSNPKTIAVYSDRYFSLGDKGVIEVDSKGNSKTAVAKDEEWGDIVKIGVFGGNLYLIDKGDLSTGSRPGGIWRYQASENDLPAQAGFGSKQKWLGSGVTPDFSDTIDMAIDGSLWVLSAGGKISKFTRGAPDGFSISGLEEGFGEPVALYTDENLDSVYILDKGKGRIVQLNKKGEYQKQYVAEDLKNALDFVVSKTAGKIFLLTDVKVLEIDLE